MMQDRFKVALMIMVFSTIAIGNQIYSEPVADTPFKINFTSAHEDVQIINHPDDLKKVQQEGDYLDQARSNSSKVSNILKESHPDEVYIGDPQSNDWPDSIKKDK